MSAPDVPHFRAGVVAVVRRSDGSVMVFERADLPGQWQLPQGGIEAGERPVDAAWRELAEETGLTAAQVHLTDEHPKWTVYELPPASRRGERIGRAQRWFFFDVVDTDVVPVPDGRELVDWRWSSPRDAVDGVVTFKQAVYREVLG